MENKLSVIWDILSNFIIIDDSVNNIFEYLYDCLNLINLNSDFN